MSLNRATIIGYLGQDPQLRYTPQGTPVCTLSVATDESYTNKQTGERKEAVEWHRVVVWGKQGSICAEKLAKGRQLCGRETEHALIRQRRRETLCD